MAIEKDAILARVLKRAEFVSACTIIASEGNQIKVAEANFAQQKEGCSISWMITRHDGSTDVEFHKLSVDFDGKTFSVYFDDANCHYVELSESQLTQLGSKELAWPPKWWPGSATPNAAKSFCWWNWSSWTTTSKDCGYNYWCFFHNQRAYYATQARYCIKNTSNTQSRRVKIHCGC